LDLNGRVRSIVGKDGFCNIRFQGQVYDDDIQLCYNRFRWYDDVDGRYISKDPIGLLSGEYGFYNYVGDSNGWVDPFGLTKTYHATSRSEAKQKAKEHAAIPKYLKEDIPLERLNYTSRGINWESMKSKQRTTRKTKLGEENKKNTQNYWEEHPDGHNDDHALHHDSGHFHSTSSSGESIIITY
ncbi:RHS repeat-associated core domain-containing protein, partial [Tenacibaculum maritimum]|uniref:RHS repeat-associated core domain-containing protein n=2 Tax=Tenacibaculum maritimum TaxID=107401 RepID=UPI001E4B5703